MGTQWTGPTLAANEAVGQGLHDARHPGLICQTCPVEVARRRELAQRHDAWMKREEWRKRWLPVIVMTVLIGCWVLGSWLTR